MQENHYSLACFVNTYMIEQTQLNNNNNTIVNTLNK
jgi:hypothetical protein